jgi:hypothetical protein
MIDVLKTTNFAAAADLGGIRFSIDRPAPNSRLERHCMDIEGWVFCAEHPVDSVELEIAGQLSKHVPVRVLRPDVAAALKLPASTRTGFATAVDLLGFPREWELVLKAVREDATFLLGSIRWRRGSLRTGFEPSLHPLSVTAMGRTGTTWLMALLGEHPAIIAHRRYPYELYTCQYWMQLWSFLSAPGNTRLEAGSLVSSSGLDWLKLDPRNHYPFDDAAVQQSLDRDSLEGLLGFCQSNVEALYQEIARAQGQEHGQYFAEKGFLKPVVRLIREAYPRSRQVFLVRDFRDMYTSAAAFNVRRGFPAFGRERVDSDEAHVLALGKEAQELLDFWLEQKGDSLLVRYEDLITRPADCLERIFHYLELEGDAAVINGILSRAEKNAQFCFHRTSASGASSIGRWRSALSPHVQALCEHAFREPLAGFGYS